MKETKNLSEDQGESSIYEIGYHIAPTLNEEEVKDFVSSTKLFIEEKGGKIISEGLPEMCSLSYSLSKNIDSKNQSFNKAFFGWVKFAIESSIVEKVKKAVEDKKETLRLILVKTVKENTIFQPKISRLKKDDKEGDTLENDETKEVSVEEMDKSIEELVIV